MAVGSLLVAVSARKMAVEQQCHGDRRAMIVAAMLLALTGGVLFRGRAAE
ncbi:MAG: hypothetical protein IPI44_07705 [Sulfuritalea sp.]|nr:hypothetical protein [Sulfuritalea sp.]